MGLKYNFVKKRKGFTVVELLVTIVILSLIIGVVIIFGIDVIKKSRERSYAVTVNNIEEVASSYIYENQVNLSWIKISDTRQYMCVSVQDLIDTGYFKGDILDSYVDNDVKVSANDRVYLERDIATKTINKEVFLSSRLSEINEYNYYCNNLNGNGIINIEASPSGWSKSKNIKINYKLKNITDVISNYKYNYKYNTMGIVSDNISFDNYNEDVDFNVDKNGIVYANILLSDNIITTASLEISKIDNIGPVIEKGEYKGNSTVSSSVLIPLKLTDVGIGVDAESFTLDDLIISIGDKVITDNIKLIKIDNNSYNLEIINTKNIGKIKIKIEKDKVFDLLDNPNKETVIDTGISFANKYNISYNLQFINAKKGENSPTIANYDNNINISNPSYENYTFMGWNFDGDTNTAKYGNSSSSVTTSWDSRTKKVKATYFKNLSTLDNATVTMTANWSVNLVERIEYLYKNSPVDNGLKQDDFGNIRYYGPSPKNYVKYNDELWKIIGVFTVSNGSETLKRVKLIKKDNLKDNLNGDFFTASWDASGSSINNGCGVNEWSQSSINKILNDYYAGDSTSCSYCLSTEITSGITCKTSCNNDCNGKISKLSSEANNLIEDAVWYLGGIQYGGDDGDPTTTPKEAYIYERGDETGRECRASGTDGNCTDKVTRTTEWIGKVGLIYTSDYGYASSNSSCAKDITNNYNCERNNWIDTGISYWTITPRNSNWFASAGWYVKPEWGGLYDNVMAQSFGLRPAVYLKNEVNTILGVGTKEDPYILTLS